ncbi:MAG: hypothetical protein JWR80_1451 [Bradyrhizobium sp.]|nr:hypothetical protein [Bradyrhizobium sp.]
MTLSHRAHTTCKVSAFKGHAKGGAALTALALALAMPSGAFAQDAASQNAPAAQPPADDTGIADVVVTARKRAENLQDTPISVTAATGADLKARSVTQVNELANLVPGMSMNQNQAAPLSVTFNIRAQVQQDLIVALDPPVGIYSDGVFLNSAIGVLGSSVVDLSRVEILKGPQGTLYGRNTTGGAVNFYTNQPIDRWEGELTAGVGSYSGYQVSGVLNAPLGEGAALRLVGEARGDGGYGRNLTTGQGVADSKSWLVRGALKLTPAANFTAIIRADYSEARSDGGPMFVPLALNPNSNASRSIAIARGIVTPAQLALQGNALLPTQTADVVSYYNSFVNLAGHPFRAAYDNPNNASVRSFGTSATLELNLGSAQIKSITAYRSITDLKSEDVDAIPVSIFYLNPFQTKIRQFTQELQLNGDAFGNSLHYALGGFYIHSVGYDINYSYSTPIVVATAPSYTNARVTVDSPALFGQATYDILHNLHVTVGLRYTKEKRVLFAANRAGPTQAVCALPPPAGVGGATCEGTYPYKESNLSYTTGIDWNINSDVMVYAKTSRGFKSGGVNERLSTNPTSATPFAAERVTDYEVGIKSEWFDRHLRINADYYRSYYNNIQRTVLILDPTGRAVTVIQNAAKAIIDGVEVEATAIPATGVTLQGTFGYTNPKYLSFIDPASGADLSSQAFNQVSKWTYTVSGAYNIPTSFGSATARLDYAWRSSRNLYPTGGFPSIDRQPGYGLLNGQIQITLKNVDLDARFYVKNILDKTYFQNLFDTYATIGITSGIPGAPRTWGFAVTKHF